MTKYANIQDTFQMIILFPKNITFVYDVCLYVCLCTAWVPGAWRQEGISQLRTMAVQTSRTNRLREQTQKRKQEPDSSLTNSGKTPQNYRKEKEKN